MGDYDEHAAEQEERRDDVPPRDADDDRLQMGDPPGGQIDPSGPDREEGQEPV